MSIFSNNFYGMIVKKIRENDKLTLASLSKLTGIDKAGISRLETSSNLAYDRYDLLFNYFKVSKEFVINAENNLSNAFVKFMDSIIEISSSVDKNYQILQNDFLEYKDSILSFVLDLADFIYAYFKRDYTVLNYQVILDNIEFLSDEYQAYAYIYIAQYLEDQKNMDKSFTYLKKAETKKNDSLQIKAFFYYVISRWYLHNDYIAEALDANKKAEALFFQLQNYNRLINVNIQNGKQYRSLHLFKHALKSDLKTLSHVENNKDLDVERNALLNNIGWTYLLLGDYQESIKYISQIPMESKTFNHYFEEVTSYVMLEQYEQAIKVCENGLAASKGNKRDYDLLMWFQEYLQNNHSKLGLKKYRDIYDKYKNELSNLNKEFFLKLLMYFYMKQGDYKKSTELAIEIMQLEVK